MKDGSARAAVLLVCAACSAAPADLASVEAPGVPAAPAAPERPRTIDLGTALKLAAGASLDIFEARAKIREAQGQAHWADGYLFPTLSVGTLVGQATGNIQGSFGNFQNVSYNTANVLGVVQFTANVGDAVYKDLAAHRVLDAERSEELAVIDRTLLTAAERYLDLVRSEAEVTLQARLVSETGAIRTLTEAKEQAGLASALDSDRARDQAAAAEQKLIIARNDRQVSSKTLATFLRLDSTVDLAPADRDVVPASLVNPADTIQTWLERAARQRAELPALRFRVQAAKNEEQAAQWGAWGPQISASALFGAIGPAFDSSLSSRSIWGAFAGWTFSPGSFGRIEVAEARTEQAGIALEKFKDRLQGAVSSAYEAYALARAQLDPAQRGLEASERALGTATMLFGRGALNLSDLVLTQLSAEQARLRRLDAVSRYNGAQFRLLGESGASTAESYVGSR